MASIETSLEIIERLITISSLTNELKNAFYKKLFRKWIDTNQNIKDSLEKLIQDVNENSCPDLLVEHILGCLEDIKSHAAEFRKRIGKKKKSDQDAGSNVKKVFKSVSKWFL